MKLLSLIMTHKEAAETVARHLPIWKNIGGEIIFTSPVDSKMLDFYDEGADNPYQQILIGEAEHHGEKSAQRITKIFEYALNWDWEYLLLMEYDSFALALPPEVMPDKGGVSAAVYSQNKPIKYRGKFYLHYPMLFTRSGLERTLEKLEVVKTNDRYFSDRFIGRAVEYARIPVKNLLANRKAYSKNTLLPEHYSKLRKAVKGGAVFFHGVKSQATLNVIQKNES